MMKLQEIESRKLKITTISWGLEDPEKCMLCYLLFSACHIEVPFLSWPPPLQIPYKRP